MRQKYINCEGWRRGGGEEWSLNLKQLLCSCPPPRQAKVAMRNLCFASTDVPRPAHSILHSSNPAVHRGYITYLHLGKKENPKVLLACKLANIQTSIIHWVCAYGGGGAS